MKFSLFQVNKMSSSYSLIMNKKHTNHLFIMKTIIYLHLINIDYYERTVEVCHIWSARKKPVSDGRKGYYQHLVESPEILVISDIRRCGKSVLLQQIRSRQTEQDFYLNFDDERLVNFTVNDFQTLYEAFIELFGEQKTFYFNEIQSIIGRERLLGTS